MSMNKILDIDIGYTDKSLIYIYILTNIVIIVK